MTDSKCKSYKLTYQDIFYRPKVAPPPEIYGFPGIATMGRAAWCTGELKNGIRKQMVSVLQQQSQNRPLTDFQSRQEEIGVLHSSKGFSDKHLERGANINIVQYLGIAADEPERIERHQKKKNILLPLVEIGWDEAYCRKWCEENDLLSPIYKDATRGGCWFCHNQGVDQLRLLRKNYPDLWKILLQWDTDSPVTFHADGRTVHDFDKRFQMEDDGLLVAGDRKFRWSMIEGNCQLKLF